MNSTQCKYIAVTGVNGFIGYYTIQKLLDEGYNVIGISIEDKCRIHHERLIYVKADIRDFDAINALFSQYNIYGLIHLAAIVHKKSNDLSYENYYNVNYLSSKNIFELCVKSQVKKLLFASTIEVYGDKKEDLILENFDCEPQSVYGKTKLLAEKALTDLVKSDEMNYAIMRFAPVYAKEFKLNINKRIYLIPDKIAYYFKSGEYSFNFCSINNILDFISSFLSATNVESGIYNISDSNIFNVKEIIKLEKKSNNRILTVRLPYYICLAMILMIERIYFSFKKKESGISVCNFNKLFKSSRYSNMKAKRVVKEFKWDMVNTLYK